MGEKRGEELQADQGPMLRPEEYTIPSIDAPQLPTEREYQAELVMEASGGSTDASRTIYWEFVWAVDRHSERTWSAPVPWHYVRFVADRLRDVLGDAKTPADPDKSAVALRIKDPSPGRREGQTKCDHKAVAALYYRVLRAGIAPKAAKAEITNKTGVTDDVIEAAARMYAAVFAHPGGEKSNSPDNEAEKAYIEFLEEMARPYSGKIPEIIAALKSHSS
jgi:hypothetical protein